MKISRTPLRISLGGGGTDIPAFSDNYGGLLVAGAINKYIYVSVHDNFEKEIFLKYSNIERVSKVSSIKHPLIRAVLRELEIVEGIEISSLADIPAGTGLGSSGTFTVGLLKALNSHLHRYASNEDIAREACRIEIELLKNPVGKQDQFIAAFGGLTIFEFRTDGTVGASSVRMDRSSIRHFQEHLLLFYTGISRSASGELSALGGKTSVMKDDVIKNLEQVKIAGHRAIELLEMARFEKYAEELTRQWQLKLERSPSPVNRKVDEWIRAGIASGALGGKLIGAGGGGFLLFYSEEKGRLRDTMQKIGLREVDFEFDFVGTTLLQY